MKPQWEKRAETGQILVGAVMIVMVLMVLTPVMVQWTQSETKAAVRDQKHVTAFNLAEAGVDRMYWKLKTTTTTWAEALGGLGIGGYGFGTAFSDVEGGQYRVMVTSGPDSKQVTVVAEGRDRRTGQVRAIRARFSERPVAGPLLAGGVITYNGAFECHWGPVYSHNDINISGNANTEFFPRKFSKQIVTGAGAHLRDTNGLNPPNTDNIEWWSNYQVPDLPILDFVAARAMAAASGTLNVRTNNGFNGVNQCTGWAGHQRCMSGGVSAASHVPDASTVHLFDSFHLPNAMSNSLWYWDPGLNVTLSGTNAGGGHRAGIYGNLVVRGNMTMNGGDSYSFVGPVPPEAWREYKKIKPTDVDDASANQYPADDGYETNRLTYSHGFESWTGGPPAAKTDVGIRGLLYVGGNLTIDQVSDIAGSIWVNGNITNNAVGDRTLVFYDESVSNIPLLNVVLARDEWQEVRPSTAPWP